MENLSKFENENIVFSQDLLLDIIIDHSIHDLEGKVCRTTLRLVRLVHPTWKESASRVLRKRKEPVFQLYLDHINSKTRSNHVRENGKALDTFMDTTSNSTSIAPLKLTICEGFLLNENYLSLLRFWTHPSAAGLLEVHLVGIRKRIDLNPIVPRGSFPLLRKLTVTLFPPNWGNDDNREGESVQCFRSLVLAFLDGVESSEFEFILDGFYVSQIPFNFILPSTLHKLELKVSMTKEKLEGLLLRRPLPNLHSLKLHVRHWGREELMVIPNLEIVRSLVVLKLDKTGYPHTFPEVVDLPVMENLRELHLLGGANVQITAVQQRSLEKRLPNLEKIVFSEQSEELLRNWVECSTYPKVKTLEVELRKRGILSLGSKKMDMIQRAFPNVTKLTISLTASDMSGLKVIFGEMKQLQQLRIVVHAKTSTIEKTGMAEAWDALFTGLPRKKVKQLRGQPEMWGQVDLKAMECQGIRNLEELTHFDLEVRWVPRRNYVIKLLPQPLISDLAFTLGFLQLEKLFHFEYDDEISEPAAVAHLTQLWRNKPRR